MFRCAAHMQHTFFDNLCFIMSTNPLLNPQEYSDMYWNGDFHGSDRARDIGRDVALMNAQYDFDESWYNEHESFGAKLDEMIAAGVNPIHAARAAMGSLSQDAGSQPTASSNGYNSADALLHGVNQGVSNVNQAVMTDLAMQKKDAEINKMQSEAALNFANAGEVAGLSASTQAKNYSSAAKDDVSVGNIEAQTKLLGEQYNLTKEQTRLAMQQADAFSDMNKAELDNLRAKTAEYWSQVQVNKSEEKKLEHETDLVDAEKVLTEAKTDTEEEIRNKVVSDTVGIRLQNTAQQQINDFQELIGRPLNADTKDALNGYVERGDYQGASNFLRCIFDVAESQANAESIGRGPTVLGSKFPTYNSRRQIKLYYNRSRKNPHD